MIEFKRMALSQRPLATASVHYIFYNIIFHMMMTRIYFHQGAIEIIYTPPKNIYSHTHDTQNIYILKKGKRRPISIYMIILLYKMTL